MKILRIVSAVVAVLGVLLLIGTLVLCSMVKSNEYVELYTDLTGNELTPAVVDEVLGYVDMLFDEDELGDMALEIFALRLFAVSTVLYIVGAVMVVLGVAGVVVSFLVRKPAPRYVPQSAPVAPSAPTMGDNWF